MIKKFKQFENNSSDIKENIDMYMYSITDEYQSDSSGDFSDYLNGVLRVIYKHIIVEKSQYEDFVKKLKRVCSIITKEFNLTENIEINKYASNGDYLGGYDNISVKNIDRVNPFKMNKDPKNPLIRILTTKGGYAAKNYIRVTIKFFSNNYDRHSLNESKESQNIKDYSNSEFEFSLGYKEFEESDYKKWNYIKNDKEIYFFDKGEHFATAYKYYYNYYTIKSDVPIDSKWNKIYLNVIKSDIDNLMYSITDEFQNGSSEDGIFIVVQKNRRLWITYKNIILNKSNKQTIIQKIKKISKIAKAENDLEVLICATNIQSEYALADMIFDPDVDKLRLYNEAIIEIYFNKFL